MRDAEYEVGVVGQETFEQTLENMAAYAPLYARTYEADPATRTGPENAYLSKVVESRRYAKLVEDLGGSDADRCAEQLVQRLKEDVAKFARMKAEWKPDHEGGLFGEVGPRSDDSLEDQSDLPSALASRLYACQLLVGHFQVAQALPQVLAAVDVMEGSLLINWGAAMYACDKVLSAEPDAAMPPAQRAVREEYLAWKRALAKEDPERFRFFDYQTKEFPAYDSVARANERAAIMGLRVEKGKRPDVTVEYPPPITQLMPLAALSPTGPQQEVVAFARRFVDAGTQ